MSATPDPPTGVGDAAGDDVETDVLDGNAATSVIRGAAVRGLTYVFSTGLIAVAFFFVLRDMGKDTFGRFATAIAIASIAQAIGDVAVNTVAQRLLVEAKPADRPRLLGQLVGLRLWLMPAASVVAVAFAFAVGYPSDEIAATAVACLGTIIFVTAAAWTAPLVIELRAGRASMVEFIRQITIALGLGTVVLLSGSIVAYSAVYVVSGIVAIVAALALLEPRWRTIAWPTRETVRLVAREAAWLAIAMTVNSLFLKVLTVVSSLATTEAQTGLFAAAARVTEIIAALPLLLAAVAFPVMTRAVRDRDIARLANALRGVVTGVLLLVGLAVVVVVIAAQPLIDFFASKEYAEAGPVLQLQAFALLASCCTQAMVWALIALRSERLLVVTNLFALAVLVGVGALFISARGARGAAEAAVIGEVVLVGITLLALRRAEAGAVPQLLPLAKIVVATLIITGLGSLLPFTPILAAAVSGLVYIGVVLGLRMVPAEFLAAIPGRQPAAPAV